MWEFYNFISHIKCKTFNTGTLEQDKGLISLPSLFQSDCPLRSPIFKLVLRRKHFPRASAACDFNWVLDYALWKNHVDSTFVRSVVQPMQKKNPNNLFSICKCLFWLNIGFMLLSLRKTNMFPVQSYKLDQSWRFVRTPTK